jgi:hypothetical protein
MSEVLSEDPRVMAGGDRRRTLLVALLALALVQLAHLLDVFRYADDAKLSSVLLDRQALFGIGAAAVAFVAVLRNERFARQLAAVAGGVVAVAFTLYHGIPFDLGVNNPYWGPNAHADLIRWLTVIAAIAVGVWTAWLALHTAEQRRVASVSP